MRQITCILEQLSITQGVDPVILKKASEISMPKFLHFDREQSILMPGQNSDALYVLCQGRASAYSSDTDKQVLLRTFVPFEIFGISNLFTKNDFATHIIAKTQCTVLMLNKPFLMYLIDHDSRVRYQYIEFLAQKTLYLNRKIACLTAGNVEQKLAFWLVANAQDQVVQLDIPMNALCTMLDIGRASLYRSFDKLEKDGFISRKNKTVLLLDAEHMLEYYK